MHAIERRAAIIDFKQTLLRAAEGGSEEIEGVEAIGGKC